MTMRHFVSLVAPRRRLDFIIKLLIVVVLGNVVAMAVVYSVHGHYPSGLRGQIVETTIIGLPFAWAFLKIIAYLYELQLQLAELATTDVLTGLRNRRAFLDQVADLQGAGRDGHLFLLDADYFKAINDTYGHDVGDACLRAIARHLLDLSGPQDVVARIGGEEFAVFRPDPAHPDPVTFGAQMCRPFGVAQEAEADLTVSLSAGCVVAPADVSLKTLLGQADKLLYRAKTEGRRRCVMADPSRRGPVLEPVA